MKKLVIFLGICVFASCSHFSQRSGLTSHNEVVSFCDTKIHMTMAQMESVSDSMPRNVLDADATRWNLRANIPAEWCGGFWDGCLWYDYALTGKADVLAAATKTGNDMLYLASTPIFDHDLGFLTITSLLNGYRFSPDSVTRAIYREALLACADSLATLFNPAVGTILSWPRNVEMFGGHNTIMDNMLNLELLFWAAEELEESKVESQKSKANDLRNIAISHADTTMTYHFREDGTCYHVAVYDPVTGKHLYNCTHQGYADESVWARGQAWAIYGYTMVYRYTHEPRHLEMACKAADVYLRMLPEDAVPYWDFKSPQPCSKDASAAAVVASALYELAHYVEHAQASAYREEADRMMRFLSSEAYLAPANNPAILLHSTGHHPAGSEIDAAIIYADYYFLEALYR